MRAWARAWVGALVGLGLALGVAATSGAASGKRVALVIGNSHYTRVRELGSPVEDAQRWAVRLADAGFNVDQCLDCKLQTMRDKLDAFYKRVAEGDEAFFYYSGHGAEQGDFNYLFPVDADVHGCGTLAEQGISLSYVLDVMDKARVKVVVLDACRTSPFATCTKAIDGSLFGPPKMMPGGTLIAYATTRGDPARDEGQGSAFSKALLPHAFEPGKPLYQALSEAAALVQGATGNTQTPTTYTSMAGVPYVLVPTSSLAATADAAWAKIAAMAEGGEKSSAALDFLAQYGSTGAPSVASAKAYLQGLGGASGGGPGTTGSSSVSAVVSTPVPTSTPLGKVGDSPVGGPTGRTYVARKGTAGEMTFIGLSEGVFDMGSPEGGGDSGEHPQHRVRISAFAIGQSEVTQAQWTAVVTAAQKAKDKDAKGLKLDPSSTKGAQRPVEGVSWCDAARFANALSRLEGKRSVYTVGSDCEHGGRVPWDHAADGYRLPTEAEWEYAAGSQGTLPPPSQSDPTV